MSKAAKLNKTTTDHAVIKEWVEARNGKPGAVRRNSNRGREEKGLLRINFPGRAEDSLEGITWEEFFQKFEDYGLAFAYQDDQQSGETSFFCEFVSRNENQP